MKQKCDKTIVIKFFVVLFAIFFSFFANVFAQYYYFSDGGRTYQQGCSEVLEIRVNSNGQNVGAGRFHLVLDSGTTIYPQTNAVSELRSFFSASTQTFMQWTSEGSPSWKGSDYTILRADRNNGETYYNGSNKLYANVNFKPVFSGGLYDVVFGMEYISGDDTTETTLSFEGDEVINPVQQELYRTGTFVVLQEPCVADTKKPTVENISIKNNSTKVSYLSGLSFSLKDVGGSNGVSNVPYIWSGGEWTGNVGGTITNQYGIDETSLRVSISRVGYPTELRLINSEGVSGTWNGKTRQDSGLNLDVSISSGGLFDFGIEKQVTITFVVYDRAGNSSNLTGITFNKPKGPELIPNSVSPKNGDVYVNLSEPIKLGIQDDWAGVNSGTIKVTVYGINGTTYGPYTFSGTELNLSPEQGNANEPNYRINITNHEKFPTSGTIKVEVYAEDMEGNIDNIGDYSFTTRPDCTEFQCCDPVWLDLGNEGDRYYYNTGLIISGGNNPTFSVDAENNTGVIDCNAESGGLSVYSGQDDFVFFIDEPVLTILGTGIKGVLSGDLLTLSYIIEDSQVVIDKPHDTEALSTGEVNIQWHLTGAENQDDWLSGYVIQIYSGEDLITGGFVDGTGIIENLVDGEYEIIIYPVDLGGHTGEQVGLSFVVDTVAPVCSIEIITQECTNSGVEIKLSGDVSDVVNYSRWNGITGIFGNDITILVGENENYAGYVYDAAGNQGECTGVVGTGIQDQTEILYNKQNATGYECELITGSILGVVTDTCGKDDLNKFTYVRDGGANSSENGILVNSVSGFDVNVIITDGAGNTTGAFVHYTWQDAGVTLVSGENQNIGLITGNYNITVGELVNLFDAEEGACGKLQVTVVGQDCSGAIMSIEGGNVTIIPESNLDGDKGYCKFEFGDDERGETVVGTLDFLVDTVAPELNLTGNAICAKGGTPWTVTGKWSEDVQGFELSDIVVTNGTRGNNRISSENPVYVWSVTSLTEGVGTTTVLVSSGNVVDDAGNTNAEDKSISWEFDNVGPDDVDFDGWQDTIFTTETTLNWNTTTDSGCSEVSGYNYKFVEGLSCDNGENIEFTTNSSISVDSLVHGNHYTLCVQPVDNLGNVGNWTFATLEVDLNSIGCVIEESACSSTGVTLSLKPGEGVEGEVLLSWDGYYNVQPATTLTKTVTTPGLVVTGYIQQNSGEILQGRCSLVVQNIDQIDPTMISVVEAIGYECETITGSIELGDDGCGQGEYTYSWAGGLPISNNWYSERESSPVVTLFYVTGYDKVLNSVSTGIKFQRLNSPIQANDFTGSVSVGNSIKQVNWKIGSNASDGVCGSGTLEDPWVQSQGEHGTCVVDGDTVSYEPNTDEQYQGDDSCVIRLMDDEGSTFDITVNWGGVDTEKPSCTLTVQEGQSCTSEPVNLVLSSDSSDLSGYSFDGENFGSSTTISVNLTGIYTGYVIDIAGNKSDPCIVEVTGGILDLDNPTLNVSSWTGYECSTGSITVTGNDNSCGINGLYYGWEGFDNTTNINEIYSGNVGSHTVNVSVFDGAGHSITKEVTYIWQNVPVTGSGFTVENVGTGITVDWFLSGNVSAGSCEEADIEATLSNTSMCEIRGHNIIYKPTEGVQGEESCIITITDGDEEGSSYIDIEITFTGVDTKKPTVVLQGGVGESCTDTNTFLVTGTFSEEVVGVSTETLKGENVQINNVEKIDGKTYQWTVEMNGGIGKIRMNSGEVTDLIGNENEGTGELILGNYDFSAPEPVDLKKPLQGEPSYSNTIDFEWTESVDQGCAGGVSYILQVCADELCNQVIRSGSISGTGMTEGSLPNGIGYWRVISMDANGNTGVSEIRNFVINSNNPNCWIEEKPVCTDRNVRLTMTGDKNMTVVDGGGVVWSGYGMIYTGEASRNGKIIVVVRDSVGRTGQCSVMVSQHDETGPEIIESIRNVYECNSLNINIVAQDTGCAGIREYMFGDDFGQGAWQVSNSLSISMSKIGRIGGVEKQQVISVKDTLGNETLRTGKIIVDDVQPTLGNGDYDLGTITGEVVDIDVIDVLGANEGNCGIGDLQVQLLGCTNGTGELIGGVLSIEPVDGIEGDGECKLSIEDNEENSVIGYIYYFVDTKEPVCTGWYADPSGWTSGDSVMVYLTGCSESLSDNMGHEFTSNTGYNFIFTDNNGNTGSLFVEYTGFDREAPIFELYSGSIDECQTGIVIISGAVDTGIGLADDLPYSFDGINRSTGNEMQIYSNVATGVAVSGYAIDGLGNQSETGIIIYIEDSKPSVTGFTVSALNGIDVDWKELSNATDGACGSGTMYATVTGGTIGTCTISGNILSYKPNDDYVTGSDACELTIYDDEGNFVTGVNAEFTDVNKYPYVKLISPNNGDIQRPGRIVFSWTGMGDETAISGYVYRIWNTVYDKTGELTGFEISVELGDGAYNWYVYAIFADGTTGGLSNTSSFNIIPASSGGGGGGGGKLTKDRCPNGDLSDSYYDGTCSANGGTHGSAITDICGVNESIYSTEQKFAYLYSYTNGITTICPIQDANVDGYLIRSHFAKMISEFAVNVVGFKPKKGKTGCDKFDDIDTLNKELHDFAVISCELSLMGLESDGVTPSKSFNPNDRVTRAQFGTVLSRLLFGGMYNVKNESNVNGGKSSWYKAHLQALKNYGIMTKIDGDWPNYYERRGRVMIMLQRADNYGIFAGRIPAKNGVKALFD